MPFIVSGNPQGGGGGSPSGPAGGDLSGTFPNPTVATVDGSSAVNIHTAELAANAATSSNTPNTIVKRDGSGNFSAGTITASLSGNATTASGAPPTGPAGGDLSGTYPNPLVKAIESATTSINLNAATAPTSGQVLTATSGTAATWQTPASATPGGANTNIQFNNSGAFDGSAHLTFDGTSLISGGNFTNGGNVQAVDNSLPYLECRRFSSGDFTALWTQTGTSNISGFNGSILRFSFMNDMTTAGFIEVARFDGAGHFGVFNGSPSFPLDVAGDINTSTVYRVGGVAGFTGGPSDFTSFTIVGGIIVAAS